MNIIKEFEEKYPNGIGTLHELDGEIPPTFEDLTPQFKQFIRHQIESLVGEAEKLRKSCNNEVCQDPKCILRSFNSGADAVITILKQSIE